MLYRCSVLGKLIIGIPVVAVIIIISPRRIVEVNSMKQSSVLCLCIYLRRSLFGSSRGGGLSAYCNLTDNDPLLITVSTFLYGDSNVLCFSAIKRYLVTKSLITVHCFLCKSIAACGESGALFTSGSTHIRIRPHKSPCLAVRAHKNIVCIVDIPVSLRITPSRSRFRVLCNSRKPNSYVIKLTHSVKLEHSISVVRACFVNRIDI